MAKNAVSHWTKCETYCETYFEPPCSVGVWLQNINSTQLSVPPPLRGR